MIKQRLKRVMIAAIDERDIYRQVRHALRSVQAAKSAAHNHHAGTNGRFLGKGLRRFVQSRPRSHVYDAPTCRQVAESA
jgi:hypothetical protein